MALAKASYGIKKLPNGRGYSVRPWITNPYTGKKEQVFKQSKKWNKEDAKKYAEFMSLNPAKVFSSPHENETIENNKSIIKKICVESTINELFDDYYQFAQHKLKPSTIESYKISYNTHIKNQIGNIKLADLDESIITDWQMYLLSYEKTRNNQDNDTDSNKKLLRNSSIENIMAVIRNMLEHAKIRRRLDIEIPILKLNINRGEQKHIPAIWSKEERIKFFSIIIEKGNTRDMALFAFLLVTGARRGEALALHPDKINFEKKTVLINQSLQRNGEDGPTKTNANRTCRLDDYTLSLLANRVEELKQKEDFNPSKTYLFGGALPLSPTHCARIFNQYKDELAKRYPNITDKVTLHGLRHSVATTIGNQHGIEQASLYLNHSSIKTTQNYMRITYDDKVLNSVSLIEGVNQVK
ncbi:MAG: tyrosine-type recombinase/integrase [Erysipelothrix sp.]|nr:tyrosine-type recombinase/integrase [Erysipelothrix sp.]